MRIRTETLDTDEQASIASANRDALRLLAVRARSQTELRRRLEKRYPSPVVEQVVSRLLEHRFLDDEAFAQEWRHHREQRKPRGQAVIEEELRGLGVDVETIHEALEDFDDATVAYKAAYPLAKRLGGNDLPKFQRRICGHLRRRGFEDEITSEVVARLLRELTDSLDSTVDAETD